MGEEVGILGTSGIPLVDGATEGELSPPVIGAGGVGVGEDSMTGAAGADCPMFDGVTEGVAAESMGPAAGAIFGDHSDRPGWPLNPVP